MIIVQIFGTLCWLALLAVAGIGGTLWTIRFAQDADTEDLPFRKAAEGTFLRAVFTMAAVSVIVGLPLQLGL